MELQLFRFWAHLKLRPGDIGDIPSCVGHQPVGWSLFSGPHRPATAGPWLEPNSLMIKINTIIRYRSHHSSSSQSASPISFDRYSSYIRRVFSDAFIMSIWNRCRAISVAMPLEDSGEIVFYDVNVISRRIGNYLSALVYLLSKKLINIKNVVPDMFLWVLSIQQTTMIP